MHKQNEKIFGQIDDGVMKLNHLGEIARRELLQVPKTCPDLELFDDEYVIMPNHIHAILWKIDVATVIKIIHQTGTIPVTFGPAPSLNK
jgi:REP element-mobilizing transposase RayT